VLVGAAGCGEAYAVVRRIENRPRPRQLEVHDHLTCRGIESPAGQHALVAEQGRASENGGERDRDEELEQREAMSTGHVDASTAQIFHVDNDVNNADGWIKYLEVSAPIGEVRRCMDLADRCAQASRRV